MNAKLQRQELIKTLLRTELIVDQDALRKLLQARGIKVTQATLSRDFTDLGVKRVVTPSGKSRYMIPIATAEKEETSAVRIRKDVSVVVGVEFSGRFLILKTRPACALRLAQEIDAQDIPLIAGTIAGYDTILIIPRENCQREDLMFVLQPLLK